VFACDWCGGQLNEALEQSSVPGAGVDVVGEQERPGRSTCLNVHVADRRQDVRRDEHSK
jgi:hypothetical protein